MENVSPHAKHWMLDPSVTFLNHGSFGACPRVVIDVQRDLRERIERQPVRFLHRELETRLDEARAALAKLLGADPIDLAWVPNATTGVNAVLRSLCLEPGDELLTTDHDYNACVNAMHFVAERSGAAIRIARVPFPIRSSDDVFDAVMEAVTERTRLVMLAHVTSSTGLIWPVERIVQALEERGVDALVDGAHAPGMLNVNIDALNAAYYTGNCHKWLCSPKGAGFLHVRRDRQAPIRPTSISHAANTNRTNRSRFLMEFDWTGTTDPTPYLTVPAAIDFLSKLMPGGLEALRDYNRGLTLEGRRMLCQTLGIEEPCPQEMIGSLATVPLPDLMPDGELTHPQRGMFIPICELQDKLWIDHRIEVPIFGGPNARQLLLRISMAAYNTIGDCRRLIEALGGYLR